MHGLCHIEELFIRRFNLFTDSLIESVLFLLPVFQSVYCMFLLTLIFPY